MEEEDVRKRTVAGRNLAKKISGGEGGIRTREKLAPLHDFQSCPFGRSGTSPAQIGDVLKPLKCESNQRLNVDGI